MKERLPNADEVELITFDCYGTLIDWESGIREALERQMQSAGIEWQDRYFDLYLECEAKEQCKLYRRYRDVLAAAEAEVLKAAGVTRLPEPRLAASLGTWKPFSDTAQALQRLSEKYKLGVLSNVDRDLFLDTAEHLPVGFEIVVTAQDVCYYKPGPAHFSTMLARTGLEKHQVLHAAQSLYHDIQPCNELNIPCVWINRRGEARPQSVQLLGEYPDVVSFAVAML